MTLLARPGFPATDLAGLVAEMRRQGEALDLATSGLGSASHLCATLFQHALGAKATTVVFRGGAPTITDVMAGRIDLFCDQATNMVPFIRDGRILGYAVTSPRRLDGLAQLPTTTEGGLPVW
jgi:tripartite-type tricarboxylate transporter receptor subunit TctC